MIQAKETKLGDRVLIFIDRINRLIILTGQQRPKLDDQIIEGTVIATDNRGHRIIGWKSNEKRPIDITGPAEKIAHLHAPNYHPNFDEFIYGFRYYSNEYFHSIISEAPPVPNKPNKLYNDISDWRAWSHNVPGECACGISKSRCVYHG